MVIPSVAGLSFTQADLDFVVAEAAPGAADKERLKQLVQEDVEFRQALVGDDKVFQRVMNDDEIFVKISPTFYFEVLLRRALRELEVATHTVERTGKQSIPVFDTRDVVELLGRPDVLEYMAQMLASFTRIHSHTVPVLRRRGIMRRIRYNDMDVDSLVRLCASADEEQRLGLYKRIADVCLFVSGLFPDQSIVDHRYPASGQPRPPSVRRMRRSLEDYEREGRKFYGLASEHAAARTLKLSDVFGLLRQHFVAARKPLGFIASQYLHSSKHRLFGVQTP